STTLLLTTPVPSLSSTPPLPTSTLFPYTTLFRSGPLLNRFGRHRVQAYELTADDARLYREYTGWLAQRNMLDFDDLVTHAATLMRTRGDVAEAIAARWDYLLVDEFQDVNAVQYDLLKRLAEPHGNFFAVGDDEQSIFTWTGADPYVLVRFGRDYGIERPIVLDRNCRCSRQIFETARRVLAQNPQLFEKQLSAEPESPHHVALEAFAQCVLSAHFLQEVMASPPFPLSANAERGDAGDFLVAVRTLARRRPAQHPDTKKLWRLVYQVENLRALSRSHRALLPL